MLKAIQAVTFSVTDFDASKEAFETFLGYVAKESGVISEDLAKFWQAKNCTGRRYAVMQPASGEEVYFRLVEAPVTEGYKPLCSYGWNAAELHVQDVYALADSLADSPFTIVGGPRDLLNNDAVIALQMRGPSNEMIYLTQMNHAGMKKVYGTAVSPVGRIFIAVQGARDLEQSIAYYEQVAVRTTSRKNFNIRVLAKAHGLDELEAKFNISSAVLEQPFRIEIDDYPESAVDRVVLPDELPPGLAMVSILVDSSGPQQWPQELDWKTGPNTMPYHGRRIALTRGPAGEWIELIEQELEQ
jgi:hypothetical protein